MLDARRGEVYAAAYAAEAEERAHKRAEENTFMSGGGGKPDTSASPVAWFRPGLAFWLRT